MACRRITQRALRGGQGADPQALWPACQVPSPLTCRSWSSVISAAAMWLSKTRRGCSGSSSPCGWRTRRGTDRRGPPSLYRLYLGIADGMSVARVWFLKKKKSIFGVTRRTAKVQGARLTSVGTRRTFHRTFYRTFYRTVRRALNSRHVVAASVGRV